VLFLLIVLMVSSSSIAVAAGGECQTCGGFSLGEPVRLGNFRFIADYFSGQSSPIGEVMKATLSWT
jgi:hypothetical protein